LTVGVVDGGSEGLAGSDCKAGGNTKVKGEKEKISH